MKHKAVFGSLLAACAMLALGSLATRANAQSGASGAATELDKILSGAFTYRNLGPFRAGSWCTCVAIPDAPEHEHLYTIYAGMRNGGVWKSIDNGTSFEPVFDDQDYLSIGALAVAPTDANQVWAGTGEQAETRSSNPGAGIFKSMDAGKTWKLMGLADTQHIARIVVHPRDPNTVWVATMGHLWTQNEDRGVYKTTDGGATWKKVLYVDDKTGAIDLLIDRDHPDTLYAAMYECIRYPWVLHDGGPGSGIFKSTDGGEHWTKQTNGLPGGNVGRIGFDMYAKDPNILYAVIDNRNPRTGAAAPRAGRGGNDNESDNESENENENANQEISESESRSMALGDASPQRGAAQDAGTSLTARGRGRGGRGAGGRGAGGRGGRAGGPIGGEVYKTEDGGATWKKTSSADVSVKAGYSFNQLRIDSSNPNHIFVTSDNMQMSYDGGATFVGGGGGGRGGRGGANPENFTPFQRAFGDYRSLWIDRNDSKRMIATSDGGVFLSYDGGRTCIHCDTIKAGEVYALCTDMEDPYNIYAGLQDHESWKGPVDGWSGQVGIEDWQTVGIGDGMYNQVAMGDDRWLYNNQEFGSFARVDQKEHTRTITPPQAPENGEALRFNWTSPIAVSHFDAKTVYTGSQYLFKSTDRGDTWEAISPDLSANDPARLSPPGSAVTFCTMTTISESPTTQGVIWCGFDDGTVQVTRDGGKTWTNCIDALAAAGGPKDAWVTRVLASSDAPGTAYVTKSRLRQDDFKPYLLRTTDFGAHWTMLVNGLPQRSVNVIVEDKVNHKLLFAGTHAGIYVSLDGGAQWTSMRGNMPVIPVYDMTIQPKAGDLVAGTYGRGVWITNIVALRDMNDDTFAKAGDLFTPPSRGRRAEGAFGNYRLYGNSFPATPNEPNAIPITYYLKEAGTGGVAITIANAAGQNVGTVRGPAEAGLNTAMWSLGGGGRGGRGFGGGGGAPPGPGDYKATMEIGGQKITKPVKVLPPVGSDAGRDNGDGPAEHDDPDDM